MLEFSILGWGDSSMLWSACRRDGRNMNYLRCLELTFISVRIANVYGNQNNIRQGSTTFFTCKSITGVDMEAAALGAPAGPRDDGLTQCVFTFYAGSSVSVKAGPEEHDYEIGSHNKGDKVKDISKESMSVNRARRIQI